MLKVIVNEDKKLGVPKCIENVRGYFQFNKKKEWFEDPEVLQIVKDIDGCDHVIEDIFNSPLFGAISADKLSSGTKALILMLKGDNLNVFGTCCGDNCADWIVKISNEKDIYVTYHHCMYFTADFDALFVESGKITHTRKEFINEFYRLNG